MHPDDPTEVPVPAAVPPVHSPPMVPVLGADRPFPVRRVLCIGRNYAAHAREMGDDGREPPFFFAKSADAVAVMPAQGGTWAMPPRSADVHHEVEHVVALGAGGSDLSPADALACVCAEGVGLDMTRRDVQAGAKASGRPWTTAKDFDGSAILGPLAAIHPGVGVRASGPITLSRDGVEVQSGDLSQRIWSVPELLAEVSTWMALRPGDLLFTGTPAGVGPVAPGQTLTGRIAGLPPLHVTLTA